MKISQYACRTVKMCHKQKFEKVVNLTRFYGSDLANSTFKYLHIGLNKVHDQPHRTIQRLSDSKNNKKKQNTIHKMNLKKKETCFTFLALFGHGNFCSRQIKITLNWVQSKNQHLEKMCKNQ